MARTQLFNKVRPNITKFAILITDGQANRETISTIPEADKIKAEDVELFCVGITNEVCDAFHTHKHTHTHTCTHTHAHTHARPSATF